MSHSFKLISDLPIYGAIITLFMSLGVISLGLLLTKFYPSKLYPKYWLELQSPVLGISVVSLITLPLALFNFLSVKTAQTLGVSLCILGFFLLIKIIFQKFWIHIFPLFQIKSKKLEFTIAFILILFYFLACFSLVHDADSLDYHAGVAIDILNNNGLVPHPEWFHSRLSGAGEVLIAISFALGAENFGKCLSFFGLLSIWSHFLFLPSKDNKYPFLLIVLSSPVLILWTTSLKPLVLPGAMTTLALLLMYFYQRKEINKINISDSYLINDSYLILGSSIYLCFIAATMKLNFYLSALILITFFFFTVKEISYFKKIILIIFIFIFTIFPLLLWKYYHFGKSILEFFSLFPGNYPGINLFQEALVSYQDGQFYFPINLILPSQLSTILTTLGFGSLIFLLPLFNPKIIKDPLIYLGIIFIIIAFIFGQRTPRFFLEPFYWFCLYFYLNGGSYFFDKNSFVKIIKLFSFLQSIVVIIILIFYLYQTFPAYTSSFNREEILRKHSFQYDVMNWINSTVPANSIVISDFRSLSLLENNFLAMDWSWFIDPTKESAKIYLKKLKNFDDIYYATDLNFENKFICVEYIYAGPYFYKIASRSANTFGETKGSYALIYKINSECIKSYLNN
jgi:hypothetical protein